MKVLFFVFSVGLIFTGCSNKVEVKELNFGYIGPLSTRATFLGVGPAKAIGLNIEQYNENRKEGEPKINYFTEDDKWEKSLAIPKYQKLRNEHNIDVLFISNSDGTVALQDKILEDNVICINPLNSDDLLSALNDHTFKVAKNTEDANGLVGHRIIELGYKKTAIFHFPNDYMTRAAKSVEKILLSENLNCKLIKTEKNKTDFTKELKILKAEEYDSYIIFGYNKYGYVIKQARELGINAPFFGANTFLEEEFFDNSAGTGIGAEFAFFTTVDGNEFLANEFIDDYKIRYNESPPAIWPTLQACDASRIVIDAVREVNKSKPENIAFDNWLRDELFNTTYFEGVCGNLSIGKDGAARGIYFSLYKCVGRMEIEKIE